MADEEQVKILKRGVKAWNKWRREHELDWGEIIDLREADLRGMDLSEADLHDANFIEADLSAAKCYQTNLSGARFRQAKLINAFLWDANLSYSHLVAANLSGANFSDANLHGAHIWGANLNGADFNGANLSNSNLQDANLSNTSLEDANLHEVVLIGANLKDTRLSNTTLGKIDLSETVGLEEVHHFSPSTIGTDTLQLSKGKIPDVFLRGCGLSDLEIEFAKLYNPNLTNEEIVKIQYRIYDLRATRAIQISPLFISYSHTDKPFVDFLDTALTNKGVRFWRDIHDATAGRLETQIDRAIRQNPTVLLILSKNSIKSDWVEHEVRKARQLEKELGRDALCPIALDDGWKSSPWPKRVMEQVMEYNILDFSDWEDKSAFEEKFAKLLNGLDLFYKKAKE